MKAFKNFFINLWQTLAIKKIIAVFMACIIGLSSYSFYMPDALAEPSSFVSLGSTDLVRGASGQAAGKLVITETSPNEWGSINREFILTIENQGISFSGVPKISLNSKNSGEGFNSISKPAENKLSFVVNGQSDTTIDSIQISDIFYSVSSTAQVGAVNVRIESQNPSVVTFAPQSVSNAYVRSGILSNVSAQTILVPGLSGQAAGNVVLTEADTATIPANTELSIEILTSGVTFYEAPSITEPQNGALDVANRVAVLTGVSGSTKAMWRVSRASTAANTSITITNLKLSVSQSAAYGDVELRIATNPSIFIAPAVVKPARIIRTGLTISKASSIPSVYIGGSNQAAGNIEISEINPGAISAIPGKNTLKLRIVSPGVTFGSSTPQANVSGNLVLSSSSATVSSDLKTASWDIVASSSSSPAIITISNITYNILPTFEAGPIQIEISGSLDSGITLQTLTNATALARPNALVFSYGKPVILKGTIDKPAGNIHIKELTSATIFEGSIWLKVVPNSFGVQEVLFSNTPKATVISGDMLIGAPQFSGNLIRIPIIAKSLFKPSEIIISDINYAVVSSATPGSVIVQVLAGQEASSAKLIGDLSNAIIVSSMPVLFKDVPANHFASAAVSYLKVRNLVSGYPDNLFHPNDRVTRAQFAKMIVIAKGILDAQKSSQIMNSNSMANLTNPSSSTTSTTTSFKDVPITHWGYGYIEQAKKANLISGFPNGTFKPDAPISRAEIAMILNRTTSFHVVGSNGGFIDVPQSHWAYIAINQARNDGLMQGYPDGMFRPDVAATRAEAAMMLFKLLL